MHVLKAKKRQDLGPRNQIIIIFYLLILTFLKGNSLKGLKSIFVNIFGPRPEVWDRFYTCMVFKHLKLQACFDLSSYPVFRRKRSLIC